MKKTYIIPTIEITAEEIDDVLYTTSLEKGSGRPGANAKEYFFTEFDLSEDPELKCDLETDISRGVDWEVNSDIFH